MDTYFMEYPHILNFRLANLETDYFSENFHMPEGPWGLRRIQKLHNTKC